MENMITDELTSRLYEKKIITPYEKDFISLGTSEKDKSERLIDKLLIKEKSCFPDFVRGLYETDQRHLLGVIQPQKGKEM